MITGSLSTRKRCPFDTLPLAMPATFEMDDLVAEKGDYPVDGPGELEGPAAPPHVLLEGDPGNGVRQECRERASPRSLPVSTFSTQSSSAASFLPTFSSDTSTPWERGKANGRRTSGCLSSSYARAAGGPNFTVTVSFCLSATSSMIRVMRRGVPKALAAPCSMRSSARPFFTRFRSPSFAGAIKRAGDLFAAYLQQ